MKALKEENDHLKTMIKSMTKLSRLYTLPMKDKKGRNTYNTIGPFSQGIWILDSRATDHITPFLDLFT